MNKLVKFFNSMPDPIQFLIFMNVVAANTLLWVWIVFNVLRTS